ncbi:MAG: hypothetical protein HZB51_15345 [Chloroflexi bacterium]|nr:hypothetical protein [Chloroflexota bacterium]
MVASLGPAIALLCAALAMIVVYEMTPTATSVRTREFARVRGTQFDDHRAVPFWRAALVLFRPLVDGLVPRRFRENVVRYLYWAKLAGGWTDWNEIEFWGLSMALSWVAGAFLLRSNPWMALVAAGIGFFLPYALLRSSARKIERAITRELPDAMYLIASMVAVNIVLPEALRRLTEYRGEFAKWIALCMSKAHGGDLIATLRTEAEISGHPRLLALATKLELIIIKGAAGSADLLRALADDQAADYKAEAQRRAKELGTEITFPVLLFFFFPYLIVVASPLFASVTRLLTH